MTVTNDSASTTATAEQRFEMFLAMFEEVTETLRQCETDLPAQDFTPEQLARLHVALQGLSGHPARVHGEQGMAHAVKDVAGAIQAELVKKLGEGGGVNVGPLRLYLDRAGSSKRCDWPALLPQVAKAAEADWRAGADRETGELPGLPLSAHVANVVGRVAGATPSRTPTKGEVKKLGINPDRFVSEEPGAVQINWTAADKRTPHPRP